MSALIEDQDTHDRVLAQKGRTVSLVIAGTMILWLAVQFFLGPMLGLTLRYAILIDLLAMAALLWSFIVSWQIRRARKAARNDTMARGSTRDSS